MAPDEIVRAISEHLVVDVYYKMFGIDSQNGFALTHNVTFDITNVERIDFFAPYFEVSSLDEAKFIIKEVLEKENNYSTIPDFEEKFDTILKSKNVDFTKPLYLSVFKPDRLDK